jgi:hypothetical protein
MVYSDAPFAVLNVDDAKLTCLVVCGLAYVLPALCCITMSMYISKLSIIGDADISTVTIMILVFTITISENKVSMQSAIIVVVYT